MVDLDVYKPEICYQCESKDYQVIASGPIVPVIKRSQCGLMRQGPGGVDVTLGYDNYRKAFGVAGRIDVAHKKGLSSNGITRLLAEFGFPFGLFLLGSYYWALKGTLLISY